jgi:hypothetical protein
VVAQFGTLDDGKISSFVTFVGIVNFAATAYCDWRGCMSMDYYGAPASQFLPRALFVLLLFLSIGVVSAPLLLFIHRPSWLIWVFAACIVSGIFYLSEVRSTQARPLTNLEKILAVIAVLFANSAAAFLVVMGFVLGRLLAWALGPASIVVRILWYGAIANACFFLLGCLVSAGPVLREAFFPKTGVGNASLFPGFTWRKLALPGFLGLSAIAALGLLASYGWSSAYVLMILVLLTLSAPVSTAFDRQKRRSANPPVFDAVTTLLVTSGYMIFDRLQTGELALDRLISLFDVVAHKDGIALAIQFKTDASNSEPVKWTEASALRTAVWAIYRGAEKQQAKLRRVQPMLVLFGRSPDPSLIDFARDESIGLAVVPSDAPLESIVKGELTPERVRALAKDYLLVVEPAGHGQAVPGSPAESRSW